MSASRPVDYEVVPDDAARLKALQLVIREFEKSLSKLPAAASEHAGNALLNLALGRLFEQHGRERTAALLARIVEELWSNTLPDTPERALDIFRLDA